MERLRTELVEAVQDGDATYQGLCYAAKVSAVYGAMTVITAMTASGVTSLFERTCNVVYASIMALVVVAGVDHINNLGYEKIAECIAFVLTTLSLYSFLKEENEVSLRKQMGNAGSFLG